MVFTWFWRLRGFSGAAEMAPKGPRGARGTQDRSGGPSEEAEGRFWTRRKGTQDARDPAELAGLKSPQVENLSKIYLLTCCPSPY